MICKERDLLITQHEAAAKAYRKAVMGMNGLRGTAFERGWLRAEDLRRVRDHAERALLDHEQEHGCGWKASA